MTHHHHVAIAVYYGDYDNEYNAPALRALVFDIINYHAITSVFVHPCLTLAEIGDMLTMANTYDDRTKP